MNKTKTSRPPPCFIEYVGLVGDLKIALQETATALKTWGVYGAAAHPFVVRELASLRREIEHVERVGAELHTRSKS